MPLKEIFASKFIKMSIFCNVGQYTISLQQMAINGLFAATGAHTFPLLLVNNGFLFSKVLFFV